MADRDRERWTRVVATFEASGQSQREFAKEQELSLSNLRYWIYRLRKESRPLVTNQTERSVNKAEQSERLTIKPVRVVASVPEARREGNGLLELDLPSGTRLRFPAGTDPNYLQTLAAAL
jgi:transposase